MLSLPTRISILTPVLALVPKATFTQVCFSEPPLGNESCPLIPRGNTDLLTNFQSIDRFMTYFTLSYLSFPAQTTPTESNRCVRSISETHQGAVYNIVSSGSPNFTLTILHCFTTILTHSFCPQSVQTHSYILYIYNNLAASNVFLCSQVGDNVTDC